MNDRRDRKSEGFLAHLPIGPLVEFLEAEESFDGTIEIMAQTCGVGRSSMVRWLNVGRLSERMADQVAVRGLGVHPAAVWGDRWWSLDDRPECGTVAGYNYHRSKLVEDACDECAAARLAYSRQLYQRRLEAS